MGGLALPMNGVDGLDPELKLSSSQVTFFFTGDWFFGNFFSDPDPTFQEVSDPDPFTDPTEFFSKKAKAIF